MKTNTNKRSEKKNELQWVNGTFAVDRVNNYSDELTFFTLVVKSELGEVYINGCKVVSTKKGDFIAFPSRENEGKYYNHVFINLTDEQSEAIINAVSEKI